MSNSTHFSVILNSFTPTILNNQVVFNAKFKYEDTSSVSNRLQFLESLGVVDITAPFTGTTTAWTDISYKIMGEYSLPFKVSFANMAYLENCEIDTIKVKRVYDKKADTYKYIYVFGIMAKDVPKETVELYCNMIKYKQLNPETDKEEYVPMDLKIVDIDDNQEETK